ncbi:MAG: histidinol dehydrogenase, partial [Chloroflexi bacterium]|nr:histidinol dehydrogenase [Chloroflexota bacterium]
MVLNIRRIDCASDDALAAIAELRRELSPRGNVTSPESRARTVAAFGEPLSPSQVVERICADVAARGMAAVLDYTRRLDGVELEASTVRVSKDELVAAGRQAEPGYLESFERVRARILAYQKAILNRDTRLDEASGITLGLRYL